MVRQHTEWFTEKNISGIVGWGKRNPPALVASVRQIIESRRSDLIEIMQVTGFSPSNISSICAQAGEGLDEAITALYEKRERIKEIQNETGLSPDNLSSILHSSGKQVKEAVKALEAAEGTLATLLKRSGFAFSNISAMLNGAGAHLPTALKVLGKTKTKNTIRELQFLGFSPTNISSMLSGAGEHLGDALESIGKPDTLGCFVQIFALRNRSGEQMLSADNVAAMLHGSREHIGRAVRDLNSRKGKLRKAIGESPFEIHYLTSTLGGAGQHIGQAIDELVQCMPVLSLMVVHGPFSTDELASMLDNSGSKIGESIKTLSEYWGELDKIADRFESGSVAHYLHGKSRCKLGDEIEKVYETVEPYLDQEPLPIVIRSKERIGGLEKKGCFVPPPGDANKPRTFAQALQFGSNGRQI